MNTHSLLRTFGLALAVLLPGLTGTPRAHGAPGDVDFSFDLGSWVAGSVHGLVVQPDGNVIVSYSHDEQGGIARLNADGSVDATFQAAPAAYDRVIAQPDGKLLCSGVGRHRLN